MMNINEMYKKAIKTFGEYKQKTKAIEELKELEFELCCQKLYTLDLYRIMAEIADVYNMLAQLEIIYKIDKTDIEKIMLQKMERTMMVIEQRNK